MSRVVAFALLMWISASQSDVQSDGDALVRDTNATAANRFPQPVESHHLPNAIHVHAKVISGGLPEGDEAFSELKSLGVKSIISVDGMKPDVETASRFGLRYVHLPHGYDGISDRRVKELAKAVRDLEGTIYIHCHHGKHRSPVAAGVACVAAGLIPDSNALTLLQVAGTSPRYRGLFEAARRVQPLDTQELDEMKVEFPETAQVPPMAEAMVTLGRLHDRLQRIAEAGWTTPADHPDLDPAHQALLLRECLTELLRTDFVQREPETFREYLRDSESASEELEIALQNWIPDSSNAASLKRLGRISSRISANCTACHAQFRDRRSAADRGR